MEDNAYLIYYRLIDKQYTSRYLYFDLVGLTRHKRELKTQTKTICDNRNLGKAKFPHDLPKCYEKCKLADIQIAQAVYDLFWPPLVLANLKMPARNES